jgi:hypothetical protein
MGQVFSTPASREIRIGATAARVVAGTIGEAVEEGEHVRASTARCLGVALNLG